jgi:tryptophan-rich hypothetical protein
MAATGATIVNRIHPKKLLNSKWTAARPAGGERHFLVTGVEFDEQGKLIDCCMEAVMTRRSFSLDWRVLADTDHWLQGWK